MASKPLGYECLKSVLEYMDANLRFQLFKRVPSIRNVERFVPLNIDKLCFDYRGITINGVVYQLGIYKSYPSSEKVPHYVDQSNKWGGVPHDIDHLGFRDYSTHGIVEPGDFIIQKSMASETINGHRNRQEEEQTNVVEYLQNEERKMEKIGNLSMFNYHREELEPYYHLRDGTVPKYESLIQFTMKPESATFPIGIERVKYNKKLHEAEKYLSNVFFEGRKTNIRVKELRFSDEFSLVIRFPVGLKMKIQQLNVDVTRVLKNESLMSIIDNSSYPLKQISINFSKSRLNLPVIDTAQKLVLGGVNIHQDPLQFVLNLSHKKFQFRRSRLTAEELFVLVQNWLTSNREVGTEYIFSQVPNGVAADLWRIVVERIYGAVEWRRSITIAMQNEAYLNITCSPQDGHPRKSSVKIEVEGAMYVPTVLPVECTLEEYFNILEDENCMWDGLPATGDDFWPLEQMF